MSDARVYRNSLKEGGHPKPATSRPNKKDVSKNYISPSGLCLIEETREHRYMTALPVKKEADHKEIVIATTYSGGYTFEETAAAIHATRDKPVSNFAFSTTGRGAGW